MFFKVQEIVCVCVCLGVEGHPGRMEDNGGGTEAGKNFKVLQKPVLRSISWSVDEHKVKFGRSQIFNVQLRFLGLKQIENYIVKM